MNTLHLEKSDSLTKAIDLVKDTGDAVLLELDGKQDFALVPKTMVTLIEAMEDYMMDRFDIAEIKSREPHERTLVDYLEHRDEIVAG